MDSNESLQAAGRNETMAMASSTVVAAEAVSVSVAVVAAKDESLSSSSSSSSSTNSRRRLLSRSHLLDQIGNDAARYWPTLTPDQKTDKELILQALRQSPTLPPKSEFERTFPQSLRFDRDVVLGFCHRPDFEKLFVERLLYVPGCLTSDKQVMLAYCQRIPRSLQECSEELCNDPEVVQAAISLGGLELQYASLRLQEDIDMVQTACRSHGRALEYCPPGPTRNQLVHDREFMKSVVLAQPGGGPMWKLAPPHLQQDEELLLQALEHGLNLRHVPNPLATNVEFLQRALQRNSNLYLQLTPTWQAKLVLATEAIVAADSTPEIHSKALMHCPSLKQNRSIVLALCQRGKVEELSELLTSRDTFCDDLEIMLLAVARDCRLISLASARLQQDRQLLLVSITPSSAKKTLENINSTLLRQHPILAIQAIQVCDARNLRYLPNHIPEDLWTSQIDLCLAWLQRGCRVLDSFEPLLQVLPPTEEENPDDPNDPAAGAVEQPEPDNPAAMAVAAMAAAAPGRRRHPRHPGQAPLRAAANHHHRRHQDNRVATATTTERPITMQLPPHIPSEWELPLAVARYSWMELYKVGNAMLRHRPFMEEALKLDGRVFRFCPAPLKTDRQLQLLAIANHNNNIPVNNTNNKSSTSSSSSVAANLAGSMDLPALQTYMQEQLQLHSLFCQDFLRGIAIAQPHRPPSRRSPLTMLDRDVETTEALKRLIAEYLGVPLGSKLALLRRAYANLVGNGEWASASAASTSSNSSYDSMRHSAATDEDVVDPGGEDMEVEALLGDNNDHLPPEHHDNHDHAHHAHPDFLELDAPPAPQRVAFQPPGPGRRYHHHRRHPQEFLADLRPPPHHPHQHHRPHRQFRRQQRLVAMARMRGGGGAAAAQPPLPPHPPEVVAPAEQQRDRADAVIPVPFALPIHRPPLPAANGDDDANLDADDIDFDVDVEGGRDQFHEQRQGQEHERAREEFRGRLVQRRLDQRIGQDEFGFRRVQQERDEAEVIPPPLLAARPPAAAVESDWGLDANILDELFAYENTHHHPHNDHQGLEYLRPVAAANVAAAELEDDANPGGLTFHGF